MTTDLSLLQPPEKRALDRLRARARRHGYRVEKARGREHANNCGGLMLIDDRGNYVVAGASYELTIVDAAAHLEQLLMA